MKEKVILAYSGGLDTTAIIPWLKENFNYDVFASASTVVRKKSLTDLKKEQNPAVLKNYTSSMLSMNFVMNISFPVYRLMPYMRTNISLELPWQDL